MWDFSSHEEEDKLGKYSVLRSPNDLTLRVHRSEPLDHVMEFVAEINMNCVGDDGDEVSVNERVRDIVHKYSAYEGPNALTLLEELNRVLK
jgi:hypothetical protein